MSLLLVPELTIEDYWVRWDPVDHRWEVSTDKGVIWRVLADNPTVQTVVGLGGALVYTPEAGKGLIHFDGLQWKVYEGTTGPTALIPTLTRTLVEAKGGILWNPNGITATTNVAAWWAPYACTVTAVKGYKDTGTVSINARKNGVQTHLATNLSLASSGAWLDGGAVQNTAYGIGDRLEIMVTTVSGSPTQIGVEVLFTRSL
jgi:hypothetical protein